VEKSTFLSGKAYRRVVDFFGLVTTQRVISLGLLPLALLYQYLPPALKIVFDVPCLFSLVTGHNCYACGLKTALGHVFSGRFGPAMDINPLSPIVALILVYLFLSAFFEGEKESVRI